MSYIPPISIGCNASQHRTAIENLQIFLIYWVQRHKTHLFGRRGDMLQDLAAEAGAVSNDRGVNVAVLVLGAVAAGTD